MISKIDKYRFASMPQININSAFANACSNGNLELVKYLLTDKNIINAEIDCASHTGIINACNNNHTEVVKYLISGKELSKKVDPNIHNGKLLKIATSQHNIELIDYLFKVGNPKKMNLNQNDDEIFISLMYGFNKNKEILQTLIVDYNLIKTQRITDFLDEKDRGVTEKKLVNEWFETRDLAETMTYVFNDDAKEEIKPKAKKMKI